MSGPRTDPPGTASSRDGDGSARAVRWTVRGVLLLFLLFFVLSLFGDDIDFDAGNTGRADSGTPYLEQVAAGLAADRVYLDPALAGIPAAEGVASGRLLDGRPGDVHVALVPLLFDDGSVGRLDLTGRRLQHLVDRDGLYVVVNQRGECTGLRFTGDVEAQETCATAFSPAELDRLIEETRGPDQWYDPVLAGVYAVLAGLGACVLLGWLLRGLGALRDRPTAYLPGLGHRGRRGDTV